MPVPTRAKYYNFFARLPQNEQSKSGHSTVLLSKPKQEMKGREDYLWQQKDFKKAGLSEYEAAMAGLYALFEPERTPKVRAIYDEKSEQSVASISKLFPKFTDLEAFLANGIDNEKTNQLVEMGLAEILALSYFFEEDDLHKNNIGISTNGTVGKVVRVDFDMSAYSIVSDTKLRGPREYAYTSKTPEDAFKITSRDLNQFPKLIDADPGYYPTKSRFLSAAHGYSAREMEAFSKLTFHPQFMERAYQTFMKIILMPDSAFESTVKSFISGKQAAIGMFKDESMNEFELPDSEKENYQVVFYTHFIKRKEKLKEELIKAQRFRFFWERISAKSFEKIINDVQKYNASLKEKHSNLRINIEEMKKNYNDMCDEMKKISGVPVSDLNILANDLAVWLGRVENKGMVLDKLRSAIVKYQNEMKSFFSLPTSYLSSWLYSPDKSIEELTACINKLGEAKNTMQFLQAISQLLSLSSSAAKNVSEKFVSALLPEFSVKKTEQNDPKKLVEALVIAIQPGITSEEGEWQTVTHFSSETFNSSFSQCSYTPPV